MKSMILTLTILLTFAVVSFAQTDAEKIASTQETSTETEASPETDSNKKNKVIELSEEDQLSRFFGAVAAGDIDAVKNSIDPMFYYRHNKNGETALTQAILNEDIEIVNWLERHGAVINVKNEAGETPLTLAIKQGNPEILDIVVYRSSASLKNKLGESPLCLAIEKYSELEFLDLLIRKGANVNRMSNDITPLALATQSNKIAAVALLIKNGADPAKANENGDTPLAIAIEQGYDAIAGMLVQNSSAPANYANHKNDLGVPMINLAAHHDNDRIVRTLLKYGANPNATDYMDNTALCIAAEQGNEAISQMLVAGGADVNHINMMGVTPITAAAENSHGQLAHMLASNGADPTTRSYEGLAAADYFSFSNESEDVFLTNEEIEERANEMKAAFGKTGN